MDIVIYIFIGIVIGVVIGWLLGRVGLNTKLEANQNANQEKLLAAEKMLHSVQASTNAKIELLENDRSAKKEELAALKEQLHATEISLTELRQQFAEVKAAYDLTRKNLIEKNNDFLRQKSEMETLQSSNNKLHIEYSTVSAYNKSLEEKLQNQLAEMELLGKKFNTEFENIANRILETKTSTFTEQNKTNMKALLEPLGENIKEFKKQVEDSYGKESNERFSLKNEVKNLMLLNQQLSKEAQNLTRALKSESKTQGRWGEMILEKILDKSGLRKNEEFFMEHQLFGADGRPLLNVVSGKKMRPDALIVYPDDRHVIIDAKVSLTSFIRYAETEDDVQQVLELAAHVRSVKNHIDELHTRAYDDYDKAMDFVMMFVPNEAAYFAALKGDANLWEYAYDRRILLISPTNLIAALKLLADLWKRERNDRNSMEIANRAMKMYEKLVSFVDNLDQVGKYLDNAQNKYKDAMKQLHTGKDNFFSQAGKMKALLNYNKPKDFLQSKLDLGEDNDLEFGTR